MEVEQQLNNENKFVKFYKDNKISILSSFVLFLIILGSFTFYSEAKKNEKILLSEKYIVAKIYLSQSNDSEAKDILKEIIFSNNSTYSVLSLFLMLENNLAADEKELFSLFDHVLKNNKFDEEIKNLFIYKKALLMSDNISESNLIEDTKELINTETLWKPHALLLLGDFFAAKKESIKAKEFYSKILSIQNLNQEMYELSRSRIVSLSNDKN